MIHCLKECATGTHSLADAHNAANPGGAKEIVVQLTKKNGYRKELDHDPKHACWKPADNGDASQINFPTL